MNWIKTKVESLDQAAPAMLLKINIFLSMFIALAHGLPLLLIEKSKLPPSFVIGYFTAPVALVSATLAIAALYKSALVTGVLKAHTAFLLIMAAYLLYFGLNVIAVGIPAGTGFSWNPILFAFVLAYPVYLARRFLMPPSAMRSHFVRYSHVTIFLGSFLVSAAIFAKIAGQT